ncbi:hypothetical protein EDB19DRAFT_1829006 [Suillus lakei]|nr:hypothetical protein EDB19DRAFT_1829006 [Suillus lakei]
METCLGACQFMHPFPGKRCTVKSPSSCKNKWNSLKAEYNHIVHIKNASRLTWSDVGGAEVTKETQCVWDNIVKVHPGAKPYGHKGFLHFAAMDEMRSHGKGGKNKAKGMFIHQRKNMPASSGTMLPPPTPSSSCSMLLAPKNPLDLSSLTTTTNEIISLAFFITSTNPSALAQQEGSAAMTMLVSVVGDLSRSFAESTNASVPFALHPHLPNQQGPLPHLTQAINIIHQTPGLTMDDILDMVDFFSELGNEASVLMYITLADPDLRIKWVERRLGELCCG